MSEKTYEELSSAFAVLQEDYNTLLAEHLDMETELKNVKDQVIETDSFLSELDCECAELRGANQVWEKVFNLLYPNNIGERNPNTGA